MGREEGLNLKNNEASAHSSCLFAHIMNQVQFTAEQGLRTERQHFEYRGHLTRQILEPLSRTDFVLTCRKCNVYNGKNGNKLFL
jgi:hypothetical protein